MGRPPFLFFAEPRPPRATPDTDRRPCQAAPATAERDDGDRTRRGGRRLSSPLPQPKSAVADFGHFVGWPNPRYSEVRLGRGRGWGSEEAAKWCHNSPPPHPDPPPQGGREKSLHCRLSRPHPRKEGWLQVRRHRRAASHSKDA